MVTIRSVNEIILSLIDFYRLAQPDLDTKPGTVARDLFVDGPSSQIALLYDELSGVANQQSMRLVVGTDLDKLAKNFGVIRKQSTPATGVALLTFSSLNATIAVNAGDTIIASNGFSYSVSSGISISSSSANFYRSVASKFSDQLAFVGITDQYAVEVTVAATTAGTAGNIGSYSLSRTNIPGISNVTNINPFTGGTDQENDAAFRNRVLASFSGSSVGTALGYLNVALGTTGVSDAVVIGPGDPLMTRDGTISEVVDGTLTIVSEGAGGKVDVVVLGNNLIQNTDTFIYQDKSNNNDPTSSKNDVVLGQIAADAGKTINKRRMDDIANGQLPAQPVDTVLQVTASISGSNFAPKSVNSYGIVSGNYELLKDTGVYGGSPFGFDTFHWVSNKISDFNEDKIKGQYNGQDTTTFTDVLSIPKIQQNLAITNENSTITSNRSIIQLLHTPATNVTRVFNVNTGERYVISNQNLDNTGTYNTTGRIQITGNTLPAPSDTLQVDYNWIVNYDPYSDYDGLVNSLNPRPVTDSVDWGLANAIKNEKTIFTASPGNNFYQGTVSHPVGTIISVKKFLEVDGTVTKVASGTFVNRLAVNFTNLAVATQSVDSIVIKNTNDEVYDTAQADSNVSNVTIVVGIQLLNSTTVILPTDTIAMEGDRVSALLNSTDVFYSTATQGSSSGNQITIPSSLINTAANNITLSVTYISSVSDLFSSATTTLPSSRIGNGFILGNNNGFNNFSPVNISRRENQTVQLNLSAQYYVELNLPVSDFSLSASQIVTVVRLSDGLEMWTPDKQGTINSNNANYQLIFDGYNSPAANDKVLIVYYATDIRRFQPFSYENDIIKYRIDILAQDPSTGNLTVKLNNPTNQTGIVFNVLEPNTDIILFHGTDGYMTADVDGTATFGSMTVNFSSLADLTNKKLKIYDSSLLGVTSFNNNGTWDILSYDVVTNTMIISEGLSKISADQISIIRILDGQEVWNYSGTIDATNNKLVFPITPNVAFGDAVVVMFFKFTPLRAGPTKLINTIADQVTNTGIISIAGTSIALAQDVVFTATSTGLKLNLSEALRKTLGLSSSATVPSNVKIARIVKASKVITASVSDDTVLETLATYDTKNTTIQNNLLFSEDMLSDPTLQNLEFVLPSTQNNTQNIQTHNLPQLGDKIEMTFYYTTDNDQEISSYTRNGTLYTNKRFAFINKIFVASGFKASQSTKFTATSFTQPSLSARYKVFYDYLAPKQNERIVVNYNYNQLISTVTFNIEETRPINADVLVREAKLVELDLTMNVVIDPNFISSTTTVLQNLRNQLNAALTTNTLGQIIDQPTLINVAQAVQGISRARILYFNVAGTSGSVLSKQANEDQYFAPNNIIINTETR